ncbi:hypothetical protein U9J35_10295 [Rossellomorea aquimaris]|nr:hypothetical protein [Rossellomorea aquimaris]WRP08926.1 hypothetical protein U9J35_10295 [Rossellomorea aquimaris]
MQSKDLNDIYKRKKKVPIGIKKEDRIKMEVKRTKFKFKGCGCNA